MSSPVLHSILQGHYVPDFIYRSTDGSVYFTRPSRTSGSTFCGYDQQTNLPMYGLSHEVPIGGNTRGSPVVSMPAPSGPRLATWNLIRSLHIGHRRFPLSDQSRVGTCYGMLGGRLGPNHDVASKISQGETPSSRNLMLLAHTGACQVEIVGTLLVARSGAARTRSISVARLHPSPKTGTTPFGSRFVLTHIITRRGHAHLNPAGRLIIRSLL
jgi:hypothetical protein